MAIDFKSFGKCISKKTTKIRERALAFLYYRAEFTDIPEATINELSRDFKELGLGTPNITNLKKYVSGDRRTVKIGKDKWRLSSDKMDEMSDFLRDCLEPAKPQVPQSDSLIPFEIVEGTRPYLEEVVRQINGCYDVGFFDASGVMIRRLVETLIIEVFESKKIDGEIKGSDGNYFMLNQLINKIQSENSITLGRNATKGLNDAKWLGDQSAHNRRFLARKGDIDRIQSNIRLLVEELTTIASFKKSS